MGDNVNDYRYSSRGNYNSGRLNIINKEMNESLKSFNMLLLEVYESLK